MSTETLVKSNPVTLTEGALNQLRRIQKEQNLNEDHGLRVGVPRGRLCPRPRGALPRPEAGQLDARRVRAGAGDGLGH